MQGWRDTFYMGLETEAEVVGLLPASRPQDAQSCKNPRGSCADTLEQRRHFRHPPSLLTARCRTFGREGHLVAAVVVHDYRWRFRPARQGPARRPPFFPAASAERPRLQILRIPTTGIHVASDRGSSENAPDAAAGVMTAAVDSRPTSIAPTIVLWRRRVCQTVNPAFSPYSTLA